MPCNVCEQDPCTCPKSKAQADDRLRMQSGNKLPRCTWMTIDRCALPVAGSMLGQPPLCSWHRSWYERIGTSHSLEERIERPAFDSWWDDREATYRQAHLWGLSKEEYWRYAHGQRIHDPKPETLPTVQASPEFITKEEFGVDLFEAIKLQSSIRQAERTMTPLIRKGLLKRVRELEGEIKIMNYKLKVILDKGTIEGADLKRLLAIS